MTAREKSLMTCTMSPSHSLSLHLVGMESRHLKSNDEKAQRMRSIVNLNIRDAENGEKRTWSVSRAEPNVPPCRIPKSELGT